MTVVATIRPKTAPQPVGSTPGFGPRHMALAAGMAVLGVGLIVNTIIGPLLADLVDYPVSPSMRNQTIGLDAAALALIGPLCLAVAGLAWRGHRAAPPLALGAAAYVAYISAQYLVGPEFGFYPGTLALHLGLFVVGWAVTVHAWALGRQVLPTTGSPARRHTWAAAALAGFVLLRYLPGLAASAVQDPLPDAAAEDVTMYWLIVLSDLGIFVPLTLFTAAGVWRGAPWSRLALSGIVNWFAVVSIAVGSMSLVMVVNDDPYASRGQVALFAVVIAIAVAYAAHLHRRLVSGAPVVTADG